MCLKSRTEVPDYGIKVFVHVETTSFNGQIVSLAAFCGPYVFHVYVKPTIPIRASASAKNGLRTTKERYSHGKGHHYELVDEKTGQVVESLPHPEAMRRFKHFLFNIRIQNLNKRITLVAQKACSFSARKLMRRMDLSKEHFVFQDAYRRLEELTKQGHCSDLGGLNFEMLFQSDVGLEIGQQEDRLALKKAMLLSKLFDKYNDRMEEFYEDKRGKLRSSFFQLDYHLAGNRKIFKKPRWLP